MCLYTRGGKLQPALPGDVYVAVSKKPQNKTRNKKNPAISKHYLNGNIKLTVIVYEPTKMPLSYFPLARFIFKLIFQFKMFYNVLNVKDIHTIHSAFYFLQEEQFIHRRWMIKLRLFKL